MSTNKKAIFRLFVPVLVLLTALGMSSEVVGQTYPEGMIAYWKFDEGSGTIAYSSVGQHTGTVSGPDWTAGQVGGALYFEGTPGDNFVVVPHHPDLNVPSNEISIEAWVSFTGEVGAWDHEIVSKVGGFLAYGYQFRLINGVLAIVIANGVNYTTAGYLTTGSQMPYGWRYVVGIYSDAQDLARLYMDGELVAENTSFTTVLNNSGNESDLYIGKWGPDQGQLWKGAIDEVAIYNRILLPEEITQHYQNGLNGQGYTLGKFTEQTSISLSGVCYGSGVWGDYDNDGDLDVLLTGRIGHWPWFGTMIYRNNGDNTFAEQTSISLAPVIWSAAAWGDYDNDGDLDILLSGCEGENPISKIYRNNGDNTFTEQTSISLTGVCEGAVAWGDYDNDGDLDIFLTGNMGPSNVGVSKIYRNNGDNTFAEQTSISFTPLYLGCSAAWGDYDNDGDLDILLTGYHGSFWETAKVYRNNGDNTFTEQTSISLTGVRGVSGGSVAWGDYDNDGDLDILLTGTTYGNGPGVSKIYRNDGNDVFTEQTSISLTGLSWSSAAWGDYDNDGNLDILLAGREQSGSSVSKIYRNNGDNTFADQSSVSLTGLASGSVAWGDYDNDGDLDILLTGYTEDVNIPVAKIYCNNHTTANTPPSAPSGLTSSVNGNDVTLGWDKSTDPETPQNALKYNLAIGTSPGSANTLSPMSDRNTGYRRVISLGNTNHNTSWTITGLPPGTYYWSVQAIDNQLAGGPFTQEQTFTVAPARALTSLGPAELFIGVTNSDNNGRRIDLKLEIFKNGTEEADKLAEGVLAYQQVAGNAMNNSKKFTVDLSPVGNVGFADDDILYAKVSVRRVGGSGNFGVRFWYNSDSTTSKSHGWSRMRKVTEGGSAANYYYFLSGSLLGTEPNHSGIASVLTATTEYQSFGTWSIQGALMKPSTDKEEISLAYVLHQSYPNPFNPETEISFALPEASHVVVKIFNTLGEEIRTLVEAEYEVGYHRVRWDGKDKNGNAVASGVYLYQFQAGNFSQIKKMSLLR